MPCIFIDPPKECTLCMESRKLKCLLNHIHLKLTAQGKKDLRQLLEEEITTSHRYKSKSGQAGRKS